MMYNICDFKNVFIITCIQLQLCKHVEIGLALENNSKITGTPICTGTPKVERKLSVPPTWVTQDNQMYEMTVTAL